MQLIKSSIQTHPFKGYSLVESLLGKLLNHEGRLQIDDRVYLQLFMGIMIIIVFNCWRLWSMTGFWIMKI